MKYHPAKTLDVVEVTRQLIVHTSPTKRSSDFIAHLEQLDRLFGPQPGLALAVVGAAAAIALYAPFPVRLPTPEAVPPKGAEEMFKPLAAQENLQATPQVIRRSQSSIPSMLAAIPERPAIAALSSARRERRLTQPETRSGRSNSQLKQGSPYSHRLEGYYFEKNCSIQSV
jgi:hypothetical protein